MQILQWTFISFQAVAEVARTFWLKCKTTQALNLFRLLSEFKSSAASGRYTESFY